MTRRLFARACVTALALFVGGASRNPRPAAVAVFEAFEPATSTAPEIALPPGFAATVDRATRDQFVGVVAGDLDHDGDLDVVASLGSLDLAIWRNDGAGHFTRLPSSRHLTFQTQPPLPSVDGDRSGSHEWIQTGDPRGADLASRRVRSSDDPATPLATTVVAGVCRFGPRSRPSRAPPLA